MKKKKETKTGPPHTDDGGQDRVTAETVVTEGKGGMQRFRALTRAVLAIGEPTPAKKVSEPVEESADGLG